MENSSIDVDALLSKTAELATTYGLKFVLAIVVLFVGLIVIKALTRWSAKMMNKREVDESLVPFIILSSLSTANA